MAFLSTEFSIRKYTNQLSNTNELSIKTIKIYMRSLLWNCQKSLFKSGREG